VKDWVVGASAFGMRGETKPHGAYKGSAERAVCR
jgi:hypothetical protein